MKRTIASVLIASLALALAVSAAWAAPGTIRQLTTGDESLFGDWSPDGQWVVYQRMPNNDGDGTRGMIRIISVDGLTDTQISGLQGKYFCDSHPAWSPNGRYIAFQRFEQPGTYTWGSSEKGHYSTIYRVNPDGTGETKLASYLVEDTDNDTLANDGAGASWPEWSANSKWIIYKRGKGSLSEGEWRTTLNVAKFDGTLETTINAPYFGFAPRREDYHFKPAGLGKNNVVLASLWNPTFSEYPGNAASAHRNLALLKRTDAEAGQWVTNGFGYTCQLNSEWNKQGTKIAYMDDTYNRGDIWTMNADGSGKRRITNSMFDTYKNPSQDTVCYSNPRWSPNGKYILAYERVSTGPDERYVVVFTANGTRKLRLTGNIWASGEPSDSEGMLSFDPTGKKVLFNAVSDLVTSTGIPKQEQLYLVDLDTADTDTDGLLNWEEELYGTDPTKKDTDGDGFSDGTEVKRGKNPLDPASHP
jgi:hypothetical protein